MKRTPSVILALSVLFLFIIACTKIDTTTLGDDLIPAVDNVTTFDATLDVVTDNLVLADSLRVVSGDYLPIGEIFDDPEFGRTVSNLYFTIYPTAARGTYPFYNKDSIKGIDSVVLQLAFKGTYGDSNSIETFRVEEIAQSSGFTDSAYVIGTPNFTTAGILGSKAVDFTKLNDTNVLIRKRDTSKVVNVLRIPLDNSFGVRLANYDTTSTSNGAYKSDSAFSQALRGLAVTIDSNKANNRALGYFMLADTGTRLVVYYRVQRNGVIDTTSATYTNVGAKKSKTSDDLVAVSGQASSIRRTPLHGYATYLNNASPADDRVYLQSQPGSYGLITIPGLDTMANKVIHRAELIMPKVAAAGDNTYGLPDLLFLDLISNDKDSAYTVQNDFVVGSSGPNYSGFGGLIRKSDQTFRFVVTRHVQGIVTRHEPNFSFRVYAPYTTVPWYIGPGQFTTVGATRINLPLSLMLGGGRVVLYGGAESDASKKMRLYIVYSKI